MIEKRDFEASPQLPFKDETIKASAAYIDNVWVRMMRFDKKGDTNHPHKHLHDHATLLAAGSIKAVVNGQETVFKAPCMILVLKDHLHFFEALEDNTVAFCVHGIREGEGLGPLIGPDMIPNGAPMHEVIQKFGPFAVGQPIEESAA